MTDNRKRKRRWGVDATGRRMEGGGGGGKDATGRKIDGG